MMISYIVRPLLGFPVRWVTEITHITEGEYFVDEQRIGPYALWHHEHHIRPNRNGTSMLDRITYAPPLGWLGALVHPILVRPKLDAIFDYRHQALERLYGRNDTD
ncbi:MAG: SRPBCC family protein, partial [Bacteroidota bacterium]